MNDEDSGEPINALTLFGDKQDSDELVEITTLIRADQAFALEILESAKHGKTNNNAARAALIQEALDLLIEKHIIAIRLPKAGHSQKRVKK